jgi:hypothetical protein
VLVALLYLLVRPAVRLAAGSASDLHNDIEIMVLRHQLAVLKRQVGRPRLRRRDRLFMAAVSRVLPRQRWPSLVVGPQTLLRWHRELVRRGSPWRSDATLRSQTSTCHELNRRNTADGGLPAAHP